MGPESIPFATPPPSLLPKSLDGHLNSVVATAAAALTSDVSAEGLSVQNAIRSAAILEERHTEDVLEVNLSTESSMLDTMTVKQLRNYALEHDIPLNGASTKKQVLERIKMSVK